MKLEKNQIDDLQLQLTINIAAEDYAEPMKKRLNDVRRKAEFKGFRKGNVPMSLIKKVYGEQCLGEAINDIISDQLHSYIEENNLHVLGEPIAAEEQEQNEWKEGADFTFKFDLGLSPELDVEMTASDKVPYYEIKAAKADNEEMKANLLRQFGSLVETEVAGDDDYLVVDFTQENGIIAEDVYVATRVVAESEKSKFVGVKAGDKFQVNVNDAFTNDTDRAAMLKIKKEEVANINPMFDVEVINVKTFAPAEESQETYDKIFGEGVVKSADEFNAAVAERVAANNKQESDYRFSKDLRDAIMAKADVKLPESFLKRWLYVANQGKFSKEQIEKEFDAFLNDFRWQLVRGSLMKKLDLKVEEKDIREAAEAFVAYQYAMYGMGNVPQELIKEAAEKNVLTNEQQVRQLEEQVEDQKVISALKDIVALDTKKVSRKDFQALN